MQQLSEADVIVLKEDLELLLQEFDFLTAPQREKSSFSNTDNTNLSNTISADPISSSNKRYLFLFDQITTKLDALCGFAATVESLKVRKYLNFE